MIVLLYFIQGPDVLLVKRENGHLAYFCDMDQYGVKLGRVGILPLSFLLVVHVDLLLGEVDVSYLRCCLPFSRSTLITRKISFFPTFMARWIAFRMVVVYSLIGIMPFLPLYSSRET
jgi:hypothetical protein